MAALTDDGGSWFELGEEMRGHALFYRVPFIGAFELTARCNLKCPACYIRHEDTAQIRDGEFDTEKWLELGRQVFETGTVHLLITGGEPLLHRNFREIYQGLCKMGFVLTLYTNGTLIDKDFVDWIGEKPPSKIGITIYGSSPEIYERATGQKGAFKRVKETIGMLLEKKISLNLRSTITKANSNDVEAMEDFAKSFNLPISFVFNLIKPVRGSVCDTRTRLDPLEVCRETVKRLPEGVRINNEGKEGMFCSAGRCSYWVSWDGFLLPCAFFNDRDKFIFDGSFPEKWSLMGKQMKLIGSPSRCSNCKARDYCSVCPGRLKAETGSYDLLSEYICEVGEGLYNYFLKRGRENEKEI